MVSIGLMCNAAMLIQAHTLSRGPRDAAVKYLSLAEIESTTKYCSGRWVSIVLGSTGASAPVSWRETSNGDSTLLHRLESIIVREAQQWLVRQRKQLRV